MTRRNRSGPAALTLWACALALTGGCAPAAPKTVPLSGVVRVNGKPAARAKVFLTPLAPSDGRPVLPSAETGADGTFRVSTYLPDDGAPPGEYAVTVLWPTYAMSGSEEVEGPDRLKGRYNSVRSPAATVAVTEATRELPPLDLRLP
ncbi:carboxypeptidase-like regulatory domain-containing protein [Gemmata sp. JC717]|uniref:carboxypeptidase-like regulatory domain-containing protein n=1 Tax=Gemmata algarum TaxID=2975278 RepID=UPI0021BAB5BA|nr:carboxypeptidase-like regulatory domain-containing protein [Gemmata algarum]MDY3552525.1 carboxypeptidase-like regulatory domain-containing protein [Gemmata algarum]